MNPYERAAKLREAANELRRLQAGFLGPISVSAYASDAMKDAVDDISFKNWRIENLLDDVAERLAPWPVWTIADLDRGKTTPAVKGVG
jgi:hypothetical protein